MGLFCDGHGASLGHQWTGMQSKRMVKLSHGHQKEEVELWAELLLPHRPNFQPGRIFPAGVWLVPFILTYARAGYFSQRVIFCGAGS
jgi:hypothetical protein